MFFKDMNKIYCFPFTQKVEIMNTVQKVEYLEIGSSDFDKILIKYKILEPNLMFKVICKRILKFAIKLEKPK